MKNITFRVTTIELKALDKIANELGISRSAFIKYSLFQNLNTDENIKNIKMKVNKRTLSIKENLENKKVINLRLTKSEVEALVSIAQENEEKINTLLVKLIRQYIANVKPLPLGNSAKIIELALQTKSIGTSLNQIAKKINSTKLTVEEIEKLSISANDYKKLSNKINSIYREMLAYVNDSHFRYKINK